MLNECTLYKQAHGAMKAARWFCGDRRQMPEARLFLADAKGASTVFYKGLPVSTSPPTADHPEY